MLRPDLRLIAELVPANARVLDLGCGDGELLAFLAAQRGCTGTGVEHDPEAVLAAIGRGVPVIELDLDSQTDEFPDKSFDVVILSRTLQAVRRPRDVLTEMARIGDQAIVSMPNFGFWRNRLRLLRGRMPMSKDLPFAWYDTPNLHHSTLTDLEPLFDECGLALVRRIPLGEDGLPTQLGQRAANLLAGAALYELHAKPDQFAEDFSD